MEQKWRRYCVLMFLGAAQLACLPAAALELTGSVRLHDPSRIIKLGGRYYTFSTGSSSAPISSKYSDNLINWVSGPGVFNEIPAWAQAEVPDNPGFMWAPDVVYFNNQYRLYYSVSSFGSQNSVIGMATNTTLDFTDPSYQWADQGMVIESENGSPYNTIDPAIFYDDGTNRMWLTFGSFWNGIYVTELNPATGKRITPNSSRQNVARNPANQHNAIEAPFLTQHDGYYFLFVNWDTCCQGVNSTYKIRVGRGTSPTGPFRDRGDVAMTSGGGELFLATEGNFIGPGHFSEFSENGIDYFSYHYYDGADLGRSKLAIEEFAWTFDGWPLLVSELPPGDYNRNGIVDAADYTVWRNTLGSSDDLRANGDDTGRSFGVIDLADYQVWRGNFGAIYGDPGGAGSGTSRAAVPEPSSVTAAALGMIMLCLGRRRASDAVYTSPMSSFHSSGCLAMKSCSSA